MNDDQVDRIPGGPLDADGLVRLQKYLAQSAVASRRKCEELMLAGEVEVDGEIVTRLGTKIDPFRAVVRVGGERLPQIRPEVYLVVHKPAGVVSTMSDPQGRRTLADLVADRPERLFHVGRLDTDTSGLILLTNDGEFAHRVAHPSFEIEKVYVAQVEGDVTKETLQRLTSGVVIDDRPVGVRAARRIGESAPTGQSIVELTIHEGRNRIVRRLLAEVGHPVTRLSRIAVGPLRLGSLKSGAVRELSRSELGWFLDQADL